MKILVAADHAGYAFKQRLAAWLRERGETVVDLGTDSDASVDYPDRAYDLATRIAGGEAARGILVCGTGMGMAMAANRLPAVRAAVCHSVEAAELTRKHNDANVLCLGARLVDEAGNLAIAEAFLATAFEGDRHARRVGLLGAPPAGGERD